MIDKRVVDDRELDGGYLTVVWTLHEYNPQYHFKPGDPRSGFRPVEQYPTLRQAKASIS